MPRVIEVDAEPAPDGNRAEAARDTVLEFFRSLDERLARIEAKVDFANQRVDLLGRMLFGDMRQATPPPAIGAITPAKLKKAVAGFKQLADAWRAVFQ